MSYSIIATVLFTVIALSSSASNNERTVLARFYSDFAQVYSSAIVKPFASNVNQDQSNERFQFFFTEKDFARIAEESLTMMNTNVMERIITFHPMPNFEVVGSRYFYRRDPRQDEAVEIELVNAEDRLFREVREPNRYFYLTSFENLEYVSAVPTMPYYEITFICNSSASTVQRPAPLLSYLDRSLQWRPRYSLDLPLANTDKQPEMYAYADIRNNGEHPVVVKAAEFVAGDIQLNEKPVEYLRASSSSGANAGALHSTFNTNGMPTRPSNEQMNGGYVYQVTVPSPITLSPFSSKSLKFFKANVTVVSFASYFSEFSTMNANGKLFNAYNFTSMSNFIPSGRMILREQERFIGQLDLPDLTAGETHTMIFGYDADVTYRRQVQILEGDDSSDSITYVVEYVFENHKLSSSMTVNFLESFRFMKYFQIQNISMSTENDNLPDLAVFGTDLRGVFMLPAQHVPKVISYQVVTYRYKPTGNDNEQ